MSVEIARTPQERQALIAAFRRGAVEAGVAASGLLRTLQAHWPENTAALARDELAAELLESFPIQPVWLERQMTTLRRNFLFAGADEGTAPLLARLAIQCHLNQHAWGVTPEEEARVDDLADRLASLTPDEVMSLACYRPLADLPGVKALLARGWQGSVQRVLAEQVSAVREERELGARVPAITPIRGGVSAKVREQYEAHPYPRWRVVMDQPAVRAVFGWPLPDRARVLIAGCGTGQHAIHSARRFAGAEVLAVDITRASLGYAMRKAREAGVANLAFAQADLLEIGRAGRSFDLIECAGVLHHLGEMDEGLRALAGVLKPGGLIRLDLYSARARADLAPAKALARRYGPGGIRELRQAIMAAPPEDPLRAPLRFWDFFSAAACRDLLMHVQEHELYPADLKPLLAAAGLELFAFALPPQARGAYLAMFPDDPRATDLDNVDAFERAHPKTFDAMFRFWARKPA